jgi:hypothetical protein
VDTRAGVKCSAEAADGWIFPGEAGSARKGAKAYLYCFSRVSPPARKSGLGVMYESEFPYAFGCLSGVFPAPPDLPPMEETDRSLSIAMPAMWVRFARTGDPVCYFRMKDAFSSAVSVPCFATKRKVKSPGSRGARGTVATNWMRPSWSGWPSCTGPLPRT